MNLQELKTKRNSEVVAIGQIVDPVCPEEKTNTPIYVVNYTGILTRLIQEAGRRCQAYASDLFVSWQDILDKIKAMERNESFACHFGFRNMGVDDEVFVQNRLDAPEIYDESPYLSLFRLDVATDEDHIVMKLVELRL